MTQPARPAAFQQLVDEAVERERRRAVALGALVRVLGAALFLALSVALSFGLGAREWSPYVRTLAPYTAVAVAIFAARRRALLVRLAWLTALVDLVVVYVSAGSHPSFTIGAFAMLLALSGLILRGPALYLYAAAAIAALLHVMAGAGEPIGAMVAGAVLLALMLGISEHTMRRLRVLAVDLAEAEVSRQMESAQNERLERLQREKDSLVQLIVHDLRSPLNAVILSLDYMQGQLGPDAGDMREAVDDARTTARRLSDMVAQILDTARLEEGRLPLDRTSLGAAELLERARRQLAPMAREKQIDVQVDAPPDLSLRADARLLGRVLENLLSNSIRHTPREGRIRLAAARDGAACRLSVHNSGPPIPADERARIFDKFQQGRADGSRLAGWGLGLYFCRMVIEAHGGHVAVEDVEGWPATFVLRLPAEDQSSRWARADSTQTGPRSVL